MQREITTGLRATVTVRAVTPETLETRDLGAWSALAERALESNAYLCPQFVLPALRHLGSTPAMRILLIEKVGAGSRDLIGLGMFEAQPPAPSWPLPSLRAYRSRHSYLTGLLVDRSDADAAIEAFFDYIRRPASGWHAVEFAYRNTEGKLAELMMRAARARNIPWFERVRTSRAILQPQDSGESYLAREVSASCLKDLRRCRRRLEEKGSVVWEMLSDQDVTDEVMERFLHLEHLGWKGRSASSLRSSAADEQFFRTMIGEFRKTGRLFFTELRVDQRTIASTCNLVSGDSGFAFKIAWDPDFSKNSPGMLNELELVRNAPVVCGQLSCIDSGADENSFIDKLWIGRRALTSGMFVTTPIGGKLASVLDRCRQAKRWFRAKMPV